MILGAAIPSPCPDWDVSFNSQAHIQTPARIWKKQTFFESFHEEEGTNNSAIVYDPLN